MGAEKEEQLNMFELSKMTVSIVTKIHAWQKLNGNVIAVKKDNKEMLSSEKGNLSI